LGRSEIATQNAGASRGWGRILLGLFVSLIALGVVLYLIDFGELVWALQHANYLYLVGAGMMTLVWLGVRGKFWQTLLQNRARYSDVFFTLNEGYLINNLLPFRLGEIARAYLLGRKASLGFWQVLSTILIERSLDVAFAVGLFLSTLAFVVGVDWAVQAATGAGVLVLFLLVSLYLLARYQSKVLKLVDRAAARWPIVKKLAGQRLSAFLLGLSILTDTRLFLRAIAWLTLNWAVGIGQYYLLALAFFPAARPLWAAFTYGAGSLGLAAPSSPGGVGVFEAVIIGALSVFNVNRSAAAAFALFAHSFSFVITGLIGGYALVQDGESLFGLYSRLRRAQSQPP